MDEDDDDREPCTDAPWTLILQAPNGLRITHWFEKEAMELAVLPELLVAEQAKKNFGSLWARRNEEASDGR